MTVGSLFSGIGGLDEGLRRAGWEHVFFCESEPYRRDVLRARFPGVPVYDDVCDVARSGEKRRGSDAIGGRGGKDAASASELRPVRGGESDAPIGTPAIDLLCGGFPCQDLSVAGRRKGLAGDRSGLFHEFARIAESLRPRWLLVENVPGLLSSNGGRDFGVVLGTLADLGYGVAWRTLDSRFFGVPQRRRRVFIVGALAVGDPRAAAERAAEILAVGSRCDRHLKTGGEARQDVAGSFAGRSPSRLDDACVGGGQLISHALTSEGHDASEDGTGRGTPIVAGTVRSHPRPGSNSNGNMIAAPLSHGSNPNSNAAGREDDENLVAFLPTGGGAKGLSVSEDEAPGTGTGTGGTVAIADTTGVRRLTPTECERLQGLPDGWTQLGDTADSKRYAALGDAVTANVAEWIGARLAATHDCEAVVTKIFCSPSGGTNQ